MSFTKRIILIITGCLFIANAAIASSFIVRHIRVRGLQGISEATVLSYVPVHIGQRFTRQDSVNTINSLYNTGFFSDVRVLRSINTLIIRVQERPVIALVQIKGNKSIKTKKLRKALTGFGVSEGQAYNAAKVAEIRMGLQQQYDQMGRYDAQITIKTAHEPRNRVALYINIHEGPIAKVRRIEIRGAHAFSQHRLRDQFKLTTPGLFTILNHNDRYSKTQLLTDLRNLTDFYFNHGYLRFHIISHKVIMSPDREGVVIIVDVSEGPAYRISGYKVTGPLAKDQKIHHILSTITVGDTFSREKLMMINKHIADYLADHGYAFPKINAEPRLNNKNHTVYLIFHLEHGKRVYVREIHIIGNHRTMDEVLRARLHQMEGAAFSLKTVDESKRQLALLPYLNNITVTPVPVAGHPDQVDLNYHVNEINAGKASVQGGYSDVDGILYGANISEPNFMGTGKYVAIGFSHSNYSKSYSFSYDNPLYTLDGVSRGYQIYYSKTTANPKVNLDTYTMNDFGGVLNYGIPITNYDTISLGFGYDYITINDISPINSARPASPLVLAFLKQTPSPFSQFKVTLGVSHVTLDRAIFPTSGTTQVLGANIGAPLINRSVNFYTITYDGKWYCSLGKGFILEPHAIAGYGGTFGNKLYPFYNNFYGGGIGTLPGFESNTLGPVNPNNLNNALGGNVELIGGLNVIFPNFISHKLRTSVFFDVGNIFETNHLQYSAAQKAINPGVKPIPYENVAFGNLRASAGLLVSWYSPLGLINVSLAAPVIKKKGDETQIFGFSFGTSL